jgi:hypothetical protein
MLIHVPNDVPGAIPIDDACVSPPPPMSSSKNDVDDISETPLMNFLVVEFVT